MLVIFSSGSFSKRIGILRNAHSDVSPRCISKAASQIQTELAVSLQSALSSPITLELHMHWDRFYNTLATPGPGELFVAQVDQVPKETCFDHDTWLTYAGPSQDFGNDCLVQVCYLHPSLNGVQQVDKARDQQLAIRAPLYNHMQRQEIDYALVHSRPTVQKVRQASQSKILYELTVHHYSAKDHVGLHSAHSP